MPQMQGAKRGKKQADKYKLIRDMRIGWAHILWTSLEKRRDPTPFHIFGIQTYEQKVSFLMMDLSGCFRALEVGSVMVPGSDEEVNTELCYLLNTSLGFAALVQRHCKDLKGWGALGGGKRQLMQQYLTQIALTLSSPAKNGKRKREANDGKEE
ncbi:hypothetical protein BX616_009451 [Lobosporangium transversale]|nr:hypothetical protein BX616_009451 [Lobosporangium transversale]